MGVGFKLGHIQKAVWERQAGGNSAVPGRTETLLWGPELMGEEELSMH